MAFPVASVFACSRDSRHVLRVIPQVPAARGAPGGRQGASDSRLNLLLCHSLQVSSHIQVLARRKSREIQSKLKVGTKADILRGGWAQREGDRDPERGDRNSERVTDPEEEGQRCRVGDRDQEMGIGSPRKVNRMGEQKPKVGVSGAAGGGGWRPWKDP